MLIRYRKDYQKIAVGLLSFQPEFRQYRHSLDTLLASSTAGFDVFLWKNNDDNHFIGIVIVETGPKYALIRQLSFTPTERSGKNVFALLTAVHEQYPTVRLMGTLKTQPIISNWERNHEID